MAAAGRTPILWDDMLRSLPPQDILQSGLPGLAEIMVLCCTVDTAAQHKTPLQVWGYGEDVESLLQFSTWRLYSHFKGVRTVLHFTPRCTTGQVWGAGAWRGASGERSFIPDLRRHQVTNSAVQSNKVYYCRRTWPVG